MASETSTQLDVSSLSWGCADGLLPRRPIEMADRTIAKLSRIAYLPPPEIDQLADISLIHLLRKGADMCCSPSASSHLLPASRLVTEQFQVSISIVETLTRCQRVLKFVWSEQPTQTFRQASPQSRQHILNPLRTHEACQHFA